MSAPTSDRMVRAARHYVERLDFALAPIPPGAKGPNRPGWNTSEGAIRSREDVDRAARLGHGWGLVHGLSGTAAIDADAAVDAVVEALAPHGVEYRALLAAGGPAIVGDPARPPKLVYRAPADATLTRHVLADGDGVVIVELRAGPVQDVLPPTDHPRTGQPYRWTVAPRCREDIPELPAALLTAWRGLERPESEPYPEPRDTPESHGTRYVRAAIRAECGEVAATPPGGRNDRLNAAAWSLARFVAAGDMDAGTVARELARAAAQAGLGCREIERTLRSAFRARGAA